MTATTVSARDYWTAVLVAGGHTELPRWTTRPKGGRCRLDRGVPADLMARVRGLALALDVPVSSVLLAAHAKALASLTGEREVTIGYAVEDGPPLPCRLSTAPDTWRSLVLDAHRAEADLLAYRDFPLAELEEELGLGRPGFDTVLDVAGDRSVAMPKSTVVALGLTGGETWPRLRLHYRADAVNYGFAERFAGYHLTALALATADPDAPHHGQSLLSAAELRLQLDGLAGPQRTLPDRRCHELFEEQVRARPDHIAAVHGERRWTYQELNTRANRVARALLGAGLSRESVVAVVTERNLDWLSAVLGVLKAGGVYLPVEPHFPADRVATMLRRADCRLVLAEPASTALLDRALASLDGVQSILVGAAAEQQGAAENPDVAVSPDQLAYIYFTSGSTGEPKGAMCEHAGMLNHVLAKIEDLRIEAGDVVAQTAPQCFDISMWQLVAPLLVGGSTLIVEQDVILDVEQFVERLVEGRLAVMQVVPSYLEAVLTYLERHPRDLPSLRCVSVTGEALKKELAERWFAAQPGIRLVNAYGLTETSDDTNHEVMHRAPDRSRVPLGRPVNNVRVYVVDEHLAPVPLGAPGELVFSGVCVGRGYVNDPERTGAAFLADPHHDGARLYRAGDVGRWLPEGKIEFLGRRDTQVKVRGFRIEIGEIESTLLRLPGIRDGAVVVVQGNGEGAGHGAILVGFYAADRPLDVAELRGGLADSLPEYMVPSVLHWQQTLPLTANGKVDRKALTALAGSLGTVEHDQAGPETSVERRLAAAWAQVLGIPETQIGRHDSFFDRGGSSLSAVKLAVTLDRAVSLRDVIAHPVLADLAALLERRP